MKKGFNIRFRQDGENLYLNVIGEGGHSAQGLPDFEATANINGKDYKLLVKDGKGYLNLSGEDFSALEDASFTVGREGRSLKDWGDVITVSADDLKPYILEYLESIKIQEQNQDNANDDNYNDPIDDVIDDPHEYQNNTSGSQSNSGSGTGTGDSGISSGSASVSSGDSSAGSSGSSAPSSSASAGGSSSAAPASSAQPSATAKTLSVDDETFRVAGVGGLVALIILVIGLYYREDIQEMMKD